MDLIELFNQPKNRGYEQVVLLLCQLLHVQYVLPSICFRDWSGMSKTITHLIQATVKHLV